MEKNYKIKKNNKQILTKIATTKKIPLKCTCTSFVVYKQKPVIGERERITHKHTQPFAFIMSINENTDTQSF